MTRHPVIPLVVAASLAIGVAHAAAQAPLSPAGPGWEARGFVSIDAGAQVTASTFTSTVPFDLYAESTTFDATYDVRPGAFVSGRAGIRLWRNVAVGVGVSGYSRSGAAAVSAQLPHPFHFNRRRAISGSADGLARSEVGLHVEVSYVLPLGDKLDVMVFGGPSVITVSQQLATRVTFSESYPFDTASYTGVDSRSFSKAATGFNAGADVGYMLSKSFGVGGLIRYSRASVTFEPVAGQKTTATAGGLQLGGGVRLRF